MCRWQQTSPDSPFTQKTICSLPTPDGRVTVSNGRLIETTAGHKSERPIKDHAEYRDLLRTRFGVELDNEADVAKLMNRGDA